MVGLLYKCERAHTLPAHTQRLKFTYRGNNLYISISREQLLQTTAEAGNWFLCT